MKATELIEKLTDIVEKHGDLRIETHAYNDFCEADFVEVHTSQIDSDQYIVII